VKEGGREGGREGLRTLEEGVVHAPIEREDRAVQLVVVRVSADVAVVVHVLQVPLWGRGGGREGGRE